jgi:hypothetical protein
MLHPYNRDSKHAYKHDGKRGSTVKQNKNVFFSKNAKIREKIILIFVMEISFASDSLAEAECEDDSKDLDAEDGDGHDDDDVQVCDDPVVHRFVAALEIIIDILYDN